MLRFSLLSLAVFSFVNAFGEAPKEIQEIRKAYANAQKSGDYAITIDKYRNYCGTGSQHIKEEFLFDEQKNLKLVRESYNWAARTYYREYLFNPKNEALFFYRKDNDEDNVEERLYFLDSNNFYSLPEGIKKTEQELSVVKAKFENYLNLVAQIKAYPEREYDDTDVASLEARFIKPEEGENNAEIKAIDEREKALDEIIKAAEEEIHMKYQTTIAITQKGKTSAEDYKEKLNFYFSIAEDDCGEEIGTQLNMVKVEQFYTGEDADMGENFVFDEKGNLQKSYSWESHEGSEGILYFLNNDKIYCLGDVREMKEDGIMEQYPLPCNSPKIKEKNLMFFGGGNYNAQKENQQLKELFKSLESALMLD